VAGETGLVDLGRFQLCESLDMSLGVVVDMRLAGTVAALAPEGGGWRSGILRLSVPRAREACRMRVMTERTRLGPGVASRRPRHRDLCFLRACWRCGLLRAFRPRIDNAAGINAKQKTGTEPEGDSSHSGGSAESMPDVHRPNAANVVTTRGLSVRPSR
jgi:hypothetical protein